MGCIMKTSHTEKSIGNSHLVGNYHRADLRRSSYIVRHKTLVQVQILLSQSS